MEDDGMKFFVGLDVSFAKTSICVISEHGQIIKEAETESEPEVLARWLDELDGSIAAIGLEAGPLSQWLHRGLTEAGLDAVLMETRQVKGALKAMLETATAPMLRARASLRQELAGLEKRVRQLAGDDPVCLRLMSMPGIGAVVALTFRAAVDDPARFRSSKRVGPWVGLTPSRNQSGERDVSGGITKAGNVNLRRALCQAATVMMNRGRSTWLRT
jgi:transposase